MVGASLKADRAIKEKGDNRGRVDRSKSDEAPQDSCSASLVIACGNLLLHIRIREHEIPHEIHEIMP